MRARCAVCGCLTHVTKDGTLGSHGFPYGYKDGRHGPIVQGCKGMALLPIPGNGDDSHLNRKI